MEGGKEGAGDRWVLGGRGNTTRAGKHELSVRVCEGRRDICFLVLRMEIEGGEPALVSNLSNPRLPTSCVTLCLFILFSKKEQNEPRSASSYPLTYTKYFHCPRSS